MSKRIFFLMVVVALVLAAVAPAASAQEPKEFPPGKWCEGMTIRFFAGGEAGDAFASIVYKGALAAEADLGPKVEYVFSGWDVAKMVDQLREAIVARPNGIAMMGHPGDDAIMPLAEQAAKAGILMMYQNVDVPQVRAKYGGGYVGANLTPQGYALGTEAVRLLGLQKGDYAIVFGPWTQPGRYLREEGSAKALEDAGLTVERIDAPAPWAADPPLAIPSLSAAVLAHPEVKVIVWPGGQLLGATPMFMEALKKQPGEIYNVGYDTSPAVIDAFDKGYAQLTSDQQPFLQGYIPVLSLCLSWKLGLGPMNVDTGAGYVTADNYKTVADWATKGYR
jgi:simple sugar transport system substrate-binding protein